MAVEEENDSSQDREMKYVEMWQMNWHAILTVAQNRMRGRNLIYVAMENRK